MMMMMSAWLPARHERELFSRLAAMKLD